MTVLSLFAARFCQEGLASPDLLAGGSNNPAAGWPRTTGRGGGGHSGHIHPHSVVSGTVYVTVPPGAGALKLEGPAAADDDGGADAAGRCEERCSGSGFSGSPCWDCSRSWPPLVRSRRRDP